MAQNKDSKKADRISQDNTTNELSDKELNSISGGGLTTDILHTTHDLVVDVAKTITDVVKEIV